MSHCQTIATSMGAESDQPKYKLVQGGNVPGGHRVIWDGVRKPFITPVRETNSIALRHSDFVVDCGAYVGTYAIRAARFPVRKVVAYEPTPSTASILRLTQLPNLEVVQAAVVGDPNQKTVNFFISRGIGVTNSTLPSKNKDLLGSIPAVSYERATAGASIVKIDVEGGEYDYPIVQPSLRALIIDFHPVGEDWIQRAEKMIAKIETAGFTCVIKPDWSCGWTRAGSWLRETGDSCSDICEPMMLGRVCCGCGTEVCGFLRSLCPDCWNSWSKRHRIGFSQATLLVNLWASAIPSL